MELFADYGKEYWQNPACPQTILTLADAEHACKLGFVHQPLKKGVVLDVPGFDL